MECSKCKETKIPTKDIKVPCFACDSCRNLFCIECSELSTSEVRCMPLQKRLLKFHCPGCRSYELIDMLKKTVLDKDEIINTKNELINLLQEKIKQYETEKESPRISYARVLKGQHEEKDEMKHNCPGIIVKPMVPQDATRTMKEIGQKVNPVALKVGIKNMKSARNGVVVLKCSTKRESETLAEAFRGNLGNSYSVELSKMRKPRVKIPGYNQEMTASEIEESIKSQNQFRGDIKVVHIRKKRSGRNTVFCECSPDSFADLMLMKRVFIGWERYPVYEDLDIPRCFHCQGYYHKKDACASTVVCIKCGGEHETRECSSQIKCCKNCIVANTRYKKNYDTNHEAMDVSCPVYKYHLQVLQSKIDYHLPST